MRPHVICGMIATGGSLMFEGRSDRVETLRVLDYTPDANPTAYYGPVKRAETARSAGPAAIADHVPDETVGGNPWEIRES